MRLWVGLDVSSRTLSFEKRENQLFSEVEVDCELLSTFHDINSGDEAFINELHGGSLIQREQLLLHHLLKQNTHEFHRMS